ncbi:hypothetical protein AAG906_038333 [Vitis piasezkii]
MNKNCTTTTSLHHNKTKLQNKRNTTCPPSPMTQPIYTTVLSIAIEMVNAPFKICWCIIFHNSYCPPLLERLGCKELCYELITWIISNYDIGYHRLCMQSNVAIPVTPQDVRKALGIPDNGVDIVVYNRHDTPNRTYDIHILEDNMCNLPVGEEFKKSFLIFSCATILAPTQNKKPKEPIVHNNAPPYEATSSHSDNPTEVQWRSKWVCSPPPMRVNVERNKEEANIDVNPCSDQQRSTIATVDDGPFIIRYCVICMEHTSHGMSFLRSMEVVGLTMWYNHIFFFFLLINMCMIQIIGVVCRYLECKTSNTTANTLL